MERGPKAPFDTICLLLQAPAVHRAMYGRTRFDGTATRQNLFVIQMIGPRRLRVKQKTGELKPSCKSLITDTLPVSLFWKSCGKIEGGQVRDGGFGF